MTEKSLLTKVGEAIDAHRAERLTVNADRGKSLKSWPHQVKWLLPAPGSVIFTLLVIGGLLWGQSIGALPLGAPLAAVTSTSAIPYQGRLADGAGIPLTGTYNIIFRLYTAVTGGTPLWEEQWTGANSVQVSDGLFNVMLGTLTPIPLSVLSSNSSLFLGISVGTDSEMVPRVQLGTVPFAVQALTVPDGSITTVKLASDVSLVPPDGSITGVKLADRAVTVAKTNLRVGRTLIGGPSNSCESIGGETHCSKDVTVTHNVGNANYYVLTGMTHGLYSHLYTITIHGRDANTFVIRMTSILNNSWDNSHSVSVEWMLIPE